MSNQFALTGLTEDEVKNSRIRHGANVIEMEEDKIFLHVIKEIILEPMFLFLVAACFLYFLAGEKKEGFVMLVSVFIVAAISLFQEYRSRRAIAALKKMSGSRATVIRNGKVLSLDAAEIVVDDLLILSEGEIIAADGMLLVANDFSVNESVLTGESFAVYKNAGDAEVVFKGTLVTSGSATIRVNAVGLNTRFGKIGLSLKEITVVKTPLQLQVQSFVKKMAAIGVVAFLLVVGFNYYRSHDFIQSFLQGLTLAMSILPEEIPVAFSTFMALGAFRLLKSGLIVKQPQYVETLGAATVICTDKTGTITLNSMQIAELYDAKNNESIIVNRANALPLELIEYAMWASETDPFDPMEKAIHGLYETTMAANDKRISYQQVHEYPLAGRPPMMTHVFRNEEGKTIIAAKGAPEAIFRQSGLTPEHINVLEKQVHAYAANGFRVLAVGKADWDGKPFPKEQNEFPLELQGLLAFSDPPKENMEETIRTFRDAGIDVKMITGDYVETALNIGRQIKIAEEYSILTGEEVMQMDAADLQQRVSAVNIYARMFPEAKLKIIEALKRNGEIVAMTGDGVNDGPALKAAHIGIAMGKRGSEVAKEAASLILTDDDLGHMITAVEQGRKIYDNLKKAIQYIVSIHIPIILVVTLPLLLQWSFTDIFYPVHVIFFELIMGPTCSIIYENEPTEPGTMFRPPRKMASTFLSASQITMSIIQGLVITAGCLGIGYYFLQTNGNGEVVRTVIFITLLFSNVLLTLVNRSFTYSVVETFRYKNPLLTGVVVITVILIGMMLYNPFLQQLFQLTRLNPEAIALCTGVAIISTCWMEIWKKLKARNNFR